MKKPEVYQQYKTTEFDPSWLPFLMGHFRTFNLPTECVIRDAGFYAPKQGRIFPTDLWLVNKQTSIKPFVTTRKLLHESAVKHPKWGTYNEHGHGFGVWDLGEELFIVEHYENWGDDGHTCMDLMGYVFVPAAGLELIDHYGHKEFAYIKTLQEEAQKPWKCGICGDADCDGSSHEG